MIVAPESGIADGLLDVYTLEWGGWWSLLRAALVFKSGEFVHRAGGRHWRTRHIHITTQPRLPVNLDGELVDTTPEHFSVAPGVLRVLSPGP